MLKTVQYFAEARKASTRRPLSHIKNFSRSRRIKVRKLVPIALCMCTSLLSCILRGSRSLNVRQTTLHTSLPLAESHTEKRISPKRCFLFTSELSACWGNYVVLHVLRSMAGVLYSSYSLSNSILKHSLMLQAMCTIEHCVS